MLSAHQHYLHYRVHKSENQDFTITFFMFLALPMCIDVQFDMAKLPINCFVAFSCGAFFYSGGALLKKMLCFILFVSLLCLCIFISRAYALVSLSVIIET